MEFAHDSLTRDSRHDLTVSIVCNLVGILGLSLVRTVTLGAGIPSNGVKETTIAADWGRGGGWPLSLRLEQLLDWKTLQRVLWYVYGLGLGSVDDVTVNNKHAMIQCIP